MTSKSIFALLAVVTLMFTVSCQTSQKKPDDKPKTEEANGPGRPPDRSAVRGLTQEYANWRSQIVSEPDTLLSLSLSEDQKEFAGNELLEFKVTGHPQDIALDFFQGTILNFSVNGRVQPVQYNGYFLVLPASALVEGVNTVAISFSHPYASNSEGLARFKDPEDGSVYTYTDFEPYNANHMFPCFDQPDIKGTYSLKVEVPSNWQVISAVREASRDTVSPGRAQWVFPKTLPFSTYLISLHCGPYVMWTSQSGSIPLRLFARKSLSKYVPYEDWFKITQEGLEFYQKYFDRPYAFAKLDQILVPDFNWGAMENVAAITFAEKLVKRGTPTFEDREGMAWTILHEMAHQWFGDLVTMKWWNDLWLNESFATFMSTLAMEKNTEFNKSWTSFYGAEKQWAYWTDQLVVTHPIKDKVPDTEQAYANFDGISYGKGASVLKQLRFYVGENGFQEGIDNYIRLHAFGNATLEDFISAIETSSHTNLKDWPKQWLETAGTDVLAADYACDKNKITKFQIVQTAPEDHQVLRDHKTVVALLNEKGGNLAVYASQPVQYNGPTPVPTFIGKACPAMVYPNYQDEDFVKVILDPKTIDTAQKKFGEIKDPFLRLMFWGALWDMVRDGKLPVQTYLTFVQKYLAPETDLKILDTVLPTLYGFSSGPSESVVYYLPKDSDDDIAFRRTEIDKLEYFLWDKVISSPAASDLQKRWFDAYVRVAESPHAVATLQGLLENSPSPVPGFDLDQDRRWAAIVQINSINPTEGERLETAELAKDKSNAGLIMSIAAEAGRPRAF